MRKLLKIASLAAISSLVASSIAFAGTTHTVKITLDCPDIGSKVKGLRVDLNNNTVYGFGSERVDSDTETKPYFVGSFTAGANIPSDLAANGYFQDGVNYNPSTGAVVCYYASTMGFDPVMASYTLENAMNGVVMFSGSGSIKIKIQVGLK